MGRVRTELLIVLGASLLPFTGCSDHASSDSITIDGSSTVYPITQAVSEEYRGQRPDVRITVGVSGTGGGM